MVSLCVKSNRTNCINCLMSDISNINLDNIVFSKRNFSKYTNIIVHYKGNDISNFYNELCSCLVNCVVTCYEKMIVKNLIQLNYFYFDYDDISCIENICTALLSRSEDRQLLISDFKKNNIYISKNIFENSEFEPILKDIQSRKELLWCSILKYITTHKNINLDGVITFRLKSYISIIDNVVDFSVNQFVINREYSEFIDLLKTYINSRLSTTPLVHLIYVNGESILLDHQKNIISLTKNNLDAKYLSDISFSSNDYALNSLLTLLPQKIIIHEIDPSDDFIDTLKSIFGERISICTNCNICQTYKLLNTVHHNKI